MSLVGYFIVWHFLLLLQKKMDSWRMNSLRKNNDRGMAYKKIVIEFMCTQTSFMLSVV